MVGTPDDPAGGLDPALVRYLRLLVTSLAAVMMLGIAAIVVLLFVRMPRPLPPLPAAITLPGDAEAVAVTRGADWVAVVTRDDRILIFGAGGGLRQEVRIERAPPDVPAGPRDVTR